MKRLASSMTDVVKSSGPMYLAPVIKTLTQMYSSPDGSLESRQVALLCREATPATLLEQIFLIISPSVSAGNINDRFVAQIIT